MGKIRDVLRQIWEWNSLFIVVLTPLLLLPLPIYWNDKVGRCAYAVLIIGTFWVTEALPIAVTSLLPVLLFPILGVMSATEICASYVKDTLMLFLGSLIVAVAVEKWDLHKRIALRALTLVGPEPKWLMLGIMLPCWFLSMWMSNTATTAMMVPILSAILGEIKKSRETDELEPMQKHGTDDGADRIPNGEKVDIELDDMNGKLVENGPRKLSIKSDKPDKDFNKLAKTFALCTAYSANCGGIATLTGTPPNIVLKGQADILFASYGIDSGITFANWLLIGFPLALLVLIVCWLYLNVLYSGKSFFGIGKKPEDNFGNVKDYLKREYVKLGPITFPEALVLADFIIMALLWVTRKPEFIPGWGNLFEERFVGDSTAAILMGCILFVLPSKPPAMFKRKSDIIDGDDKLKKAEKSFVPLLDWDIVHKKMAWGVLLLMGGGFALADACSKSGLSGWISDQLIVLNVLPNWAIGLLLSYIVAAATNITSNAATATLFLPIVGELAIRLEIHPLYFMIPCAIAASFAFLLPVGTPPNAIVFSTGYLKVKDMLYAGIVINIVSILILHMAVNSYIVPFFGLLKLPPAMAQGLNGTFVNGTSGFVLDPGYNLTMSI